jgi:hypothetical protein
LLDDDLDTADMREDEGRDDEDPARATGEGLSTTALRAAGA